MDAGCGGEGEDNFECVFAQLSSTCSTADAGDRNSIYHPRLPSFNQSDVGPVSTHPAYPSRSCCLDKIKPGMACPSPALAWVAGPYTRICSASCCAAAIRAL